MIPLIYITNTRTRAREECYSGWVPGRGDRIGGKMQEKEIEKYLIDKTAEMGGMALKFVSPGCTDRKSVV